MLTIPTTISVLISWTSNLLYLGSYMKKKGIRTFFDTIHKNKWIKDLHVRPDTIKNRQNTDTNCSHIIDLPPRITDIKPKTNKRDLIILKIFCTAKKTINKMKRQLTE